MRVFRRRDDPTSTGHRDRDSRAPRRAVGPGDARRPEISTSVTGKHFVAGANLLDRLFRAVGHRDLSSGYQALIRVANGADVAVLFGQQLEQPVLRVVRVLVLVDEDVAERLLPALAGFREALQHL